MDRAKVSRAGGKSLLAEPAVGDAGGDVVDDASGVDDGTWASGVANCTRWANAGQQAKAHSTAASPQTIRVVFTTTPPCSFEGTRRDDGLE